MIELVVTVSLFALGWWIGSAREQSHLQDLKERERALSSVQLLTVRNPPADWSVHSPALLQGNVVISWDYFKAVVSAFHMLFGGRISTLEPLLARARREALVRLKEDAERAGYDGIVGLRLETSRMSNKSGDKGLGGVEVLAYGTGVRRSGG